jgi:hypothetical protein
MGAKLVGIAGDNFSKKIFSLIFNSLATFPQTGMGGANGNVVAERNFAMHTPVTFDPCFAWIMSFFGF